MFPDTHSQSYGKTDVFVLANSGVKNSSGREFRRDGDQPIAPRGGVGPGCGMSGAHVSSSSRAVRVSRSSCIVFGGRYVATGGERPVARLMQYSSAVRHVRVEVQMPPNIPQPGQTTPCEAGVGSPFLRKSRPLEFFSPEIANVIGFHRGSTISWRKVTIKQERCRPTARGLN